MQEPVPSAGPRAYLDTLDTIQYLPGELCIETSGYITSTQHRYWSYINIIHDNHTCILPIPIYICIIVFYSIPVPVLLRVSVFENMV